MVRPKDIPAWITEQWEIPRERLLRSYKDQLKETLNSVGQ